MISSGRELSDEHQSAEGGGPSRVSASKALIIFLKPKAKRSCGFIRVNYSDMIGVVESQSQTLLWGLARGISGQGNHPRPQGHGGAV
jgi:hypothetical protein